MIDTTINLLVNRTECTNLSGTTLTLRLAVKSDNSSPAILFRDSEKLDATIKLIQHDGDRMYVVEKRMQPGDSNMLHFLVPPGRYAVFFITDGNTGCRCHLNLNEPNASVKVGMGILGGGNRKVYYGDKYVMSRGVEVLKSKIDWAATARGLFLGEVGGAITSS